MPTKYTRVTEAKNPNHTMVKIFLSVFLSKVSREQHSFQAFQSHWNY